MSFLAFNDKIYTIPLKCLNASGVAQAFPSGSILVALSSNPASLGAAMANGTNLVLTPKVQNSPGITVTVTGTALAPATVTVDVVADPNLLSISIDPTTGVTTAQNVPAAPGP